MTASDARERLAGLLDRNHSLLRLWLGKAVDGSLSSAANIARTHIEHGLAHSKSDEEILVVTLCAVADHADECMKHLLRRTALEIDPIALIIERADRPGFCEPHDECGRVGCPECQK